MMPNWPPWRRGEGDARDSLCHEHGCYLEKGHVLFWCFTEGIANVEMMGCAVWTHNLSLEAEQVSLKQPWVHAT